MKRQIRSLVIFVTLTALCSSNSSAGVIRDDKSDSDLEILVAPYLWGTAIEGTSAIGSLPPLSVDASFGDILENLNMAFAMHTEFHLGNWAVVVDPFYASLEVDLSTPLPSVSPKIEVDMWLVEAWTGYKITETWELIGGVRWQDQDIAVTPGLPSPPFPGTGFGVQDDWLDWFAGARFTFPFSDNWNLTGRADVVVAGDSDSSYNIQMIFNRRIGSNKALNLGYRYLKDDYNNSPVYVWDMEQDGPVVGFTWSF